MRINLAILAAALVYTGLAAAQVDTGNHYKLVNVNSNLVLGINAPAQTAGSAAAQWQDNGTADHNWNFHPAGNGQYEIINSNSGQVLGIANGSTAPSQPAVQWADNGTKDHLWTLVGAGNGNYKLKNVNSGLVLGIVGGSTGPGAAAQQFADNGAQDHLWRLSANGAAYPAPGAVSGNIVPVHDPSMVKVGGNYHLYATGGGLQVRTSTNRQNWQPGNLVYAFNTFPAWAAAYNSANLWAPDVSYRNNKYYMYYAAFNLTTKKAGIGLATSSSGDAGTFSDSGGPITESANSYCQGVNAIDPGLITDNSNNWWLSFGSFWTGINMLQMNPQTGRQSSNTTCYHLANRLVGTAMEGAYIFHYGNFYYLFASLDLCCQSTSSTYHIAVGRSSSPNGPYTDRGGVSMTNGGATVLLATHGNVVGPGGQSVFTDADGPILIYHYYDANNSGNPTLGLNRLGFTSDGWPYVE